MFDTGVEEVKRSHNIRDVMASYGVTVNRKGFAVCPFHKDQNGSLKVYPNQTYHCFGCGADGDCIDFVQHMENCDFKTAYHLLGGVDRTLTAEEKKRFAKEMEARKRESARKEAVKRNIFNFETAEATITRQISGLLDDVDGWVDEFWDELQKLENRRLKCQITLCRLREIV